MGANLYVPFLEATRNVFVLMLNISDFNDCPSDDFQPEEELIISIGVKGDLEGEVLYRFPSTTSLKMVNIMCGMEFEDVDDFVTSAISEIANIISGNVFVKLADENLTCDILPPVVKTLSEVRSEPGTACCIKTLLGEICLDIRLHPAN